MGWLRRAKAQDGNESTGPTEADRLAEEVATVYAVVGQSRTGDTIHFGAPTPCPRCARYGFVESVNQTNGACFNHCFECHADWVITLRALRVYSEGHGSAEPLTPWQAATRGTAVFVRVDDDLAIEATPEVIAALDRRPLDRSAVDDGGAGPGTDADADALRDATRFA